MVETLQPSASEPTQDERTMALLAQVLQIVGWWIAPLVIFLIKRQSKFVSFHALQALLLQVLEMCLMAVGMVLWFAAFFLLMANAPAAKNAPPPSGLFILMPMLWLGWMGIWVAVLLIAIVYGVKASRGEWAEYPVLGRLSRKILKLGPGGAPA
jgi:uncharacterized membrane protein